MPTKNAAEQSIAKITLRASIAGLWSRFWSVTELFGFCTIESEMMLKITKRNKPSKDAKSKNMNFLAVRQGWQNERIKAIAARKARSTPGGLSSIPITTEAIAVRPQTTKRINVLILLLRVEYASIMIISFLIVALVNGCPKNLLMKGWFPASETLS